MAKTKTTSKAKPMKYPKQQILNYLFLYHFRYKDDYPKFAKETGITTTEEEFSKWKEEHLDKIISTVEEEHPLVEETTIVPTIEELIDKTTIKLADIISRADSPERLTNALYKLYAVQKYKQVVDNPETEDDIYRMINEELTEVLNLPSKGKNKKEEEK